MGWRESASERETIVSRMAGFVGTLVGVYRRRGMKAEHAREATARHLHVSLRRVRSYLGNEVQTVSAHEAIAIMSGFEKARVSLEAEINAERENLRRLQDRCASMSALLSAAGGSES